MINRGFLATVLIYPMYFIVHKNTQVGEHGPLNIKDLIKVDAQFLDKVLLSPCFNIAPKAFPRFELILIPKAIELSVGFF